MPPQPDTLDPNAPWHLALRAELVRRLEALVAEDTSARAWFGVVAYNDILPSFEIEVVAGYGGAPERDVPLSYEVVDRTWKAGQDLHNVLAVSVPGPIADPAFLAWLQADGSLLVSLPQSAVSFDAELEEEVDESGVYERFWHYVLRPAVEDVQQRTAAAGIPLWLVWHQFAAAGGYDVEWIAEHNDPASVAPIASHLREHPHPCVPRTPVEMAD